jgi:2-polyprenyl-6-methoxyphenol hydroxylase-like FAD-dependent oxidoreductase
MADLDVPVLIVGGSLVGLSAATLLARYGVDSLTAERHPRTAIHPRAAHATQRTMEIFRSLGLEATICKRSAEQFVQNGGVVAVNTLIGGPTAEFIADLNAGIRDVSPCERVFLSQNALEPILAERATELGAALRFCNEVVSIDEHPDEVRSVLRDRSTGETLTVRSQYVIAADGAHSGVRKHLGIGMRGHPPFSHSITIYFHADMRSLLADRQWAVVYVNNERLRGFFRFEKPFDSAFLVVNTLGDPSRPVTDVSTGLTADVARELVAIALGSADIPVKIDAVMHWEAVAQVAEKLQTERVFIAGDAAHVMPPTGGFGGNTGVQDAHNLAWKLARVLDGDASPDLLQTYATERLPVAGLSVEQAYTRYVMRTDPSLGTDGCQPIVPDLNVELGYVYQSEAVLPDRPEVAPAHLSPRESHARPGTRAPHLWLELRGRRISTLDLYGERFVLLAGPAAHEWCRCAHAVGSDVGVELDVLQPGEGDLEDVSGSLCDVHGIEPGGCLLVRPDGFVAWRATNAAGASEQKLKSALLQLLGRGARGQATASN